MYKLLLVEDDSIIRDGIKENISWKRLGFDFIGGYEDGNQALEAIEKYRPDVVLTDIYMPFMDGLELSDYISKNHPETKIILITGYDKFDYAHKAVKLNVYDFILKPITPLELIDILKKLKSDLDNDRAKKKDIDDLKKKISESRIVLQDRFFNRIISEDIKNDEIKIQTKELSINFPHNFFSVIMIDKDETIKSESDLTGNCKHLLNSMNLDGYAFRSDDGFAVIILNGQTKNILDDKKTLLANNIRESFKRSFGMTVSAGIGTNCPALKNIRESFNNAVKALDCRFHLGNDSTIVYDDRMNTSIVITAEKDWEKEIISSLKTGDADEARSIIMEMTSFLKENRIPVEKCRAYIQKIISQIYNMESEYVMEDSVVFGSVKNPFFFAYNFKTLASLETWLIDIAGKINSLIIDKKKDLNNDLILTAENFINENYYDQTMTLSSICYHLCMSKSKFSFLFKKHTGMTFIEYLTQKRIKKSMEFFILFCVRYSMNVIASRVGFSDPHYFSLIFKKINHVTPSEFRTNMENSILV